MEKIERIGRTIRTPENEAILRRLAADKTPTVEIARHFGVAYRTISKWAAAIGLRLNSRTDSARCYSVRQSRIMSIRKAMKRDDVRVKVKVYWSDPDRRREHQRKAQAGKREKRERRLLEIAEIDAVPSWVPTPMVDQYVAIARNRGEEEAASWARREKQLIHASNHA